MGKKLDPWIYNARLIKGVDGDTADAWIDLGFSISVKKRIRFVNVDTWESRTRDLEEKKKGLESYAIEQIGQRRRDEYQDGEVRAQLNVKPPSSYK